MAPLLCKNGNAGNSIAVEYHEANRILKEYLLKGLSWGISITIY